MKRSLSLVLVCSFALGAQVAKEANSGYQTPQQREGMAKGLSRSDRDAEQKPRELVQSLDIKPGMTVADIGTGPGYMLPYLSEAVGKSGKVLAEDIFDEFLGKAREAAQPLGNVEVIKGTERDPKLPENSVDLIFALDSYHHYNYPQDMLAAFSKALRQNGRLAIIEYHKNREAMPNGRALQHIRLDQAGVIKEVEAAGFELVSRKDHIPNRQYIVIFRKR